MLFPFFYNHFFSFLNKPADKKLINYPGNNIEDGKSINNNIYNETEPPITANTSET